ncbi:MAG TPA: sulfatase-like hydrolase/transferase [Chloroflexota bacterium]|nr:sulfatase-like hydrolase/transferase [Chloroflexota bacterium]
MTEPTNLLFICSDEHTAHVLGAYGNPVVRTPNLDALAARGTRFTSAYTPFPICVPARACLATGRYAHQLGIWDNGAPYTGREAPSWGHRLTAQGHEATTIGKLHYRSEEDDTGFPDQRLAMHVVDGVGDVFGLLRKDSPVRPGSVRKPVQEAGPGESEYIRYDRAIAAEAERWLTEHAHTADRQKEEKPWALFVSFVNPHFPLTVPQEYFDLYPPQSVPLPRCGTPETWSTHPAMAWKRRMQAIEEPFDEATLRRAIAAYYGMVTFLDEQVGRVLRALEQSGLAGSTRVVYSTDHGDMLGDHGLWWKSVMYEGSARIPLILAGPGVPRGKVVGTPVSLVDCFPTILEATGAQPASEDVALPGASLLRIASQPDDPTRAVFAEYHASHSSTAYYMLRRGQHKYIHYVGYPPQLFDLQTDPDEAHDLAADPAHAGLVADFERALRGVCDPEVVDAQARADQRRRIDAAGGLGAVLQGGARFNYTPAPKAFDPVPIP